MTLQRSKARILGNMWIGLPYLLAMVITGNLAMVTGVFATNSLPAAVLIGFAAAVLVGGLLFTFSEIRRCSRLR